MFGQVSITSRGRYEFERTTSGKELQQAPSRYPLVARPPIPAGSPFGFTDIDWETVADAHSRSDELRVVLGHPFKSEHFDTEGLRVNVEEMFRKALGDYSRKPGAIPEVRLDFRALAAGYGEHLFNEIAHDIISADIAVFDTSDLNPNVMIEMGVALTCGVRVSPIKNEKCPKPPSGISGQTWADYRESAKEFADETHFQKLVSMVERAIRKKVSHLQQ